MKVFAAPSRQASLGLRFNPAQNEIRLINPRLPSFQEEVIILQLRLRNASLDLAMVRRDEQFSMRAPWRERELRVSAIRTHR